MENLRVLSGSVAVLNDIPARYLHPSDSPAQSRDYLLPGYFHDQYISLHLPENSLTTGTLFPMNYQKLRSAQNVILFYFTVII